MLLTLKRTSPVPVTSSKLVTNVARFPKLIPVPWVAEKHMVDYTCSLCNTLIFKGLLYAVHMHAHLWIGSAALQFFKRLVNA